VGEANDQEDRKRMDEIEPLQRRLIANIKRIAKRRGIVITNLPDRAGVSRSQFWRVLAEGSSPSLNWIERIAIGLGVDAVELFRPARRGKGR
jgi:transcriptional regulator with XRE-family HTH domain